jgi:glycosyltransferase involved in cell wall biosynthesis
MVSVVIPVCNEQANLPELRARLTAALGDHEFECIVVDDGSTDATAAMVRDMAREDPRFKLVSLSRNFGHQAAIFAGLTFARGACVAVMDGDLQDPPELIPEMMRVWRKGAEVVYGLRTARNEGWFTRATAAVFYRIQKSLTKASMPLDAGDFAVIDRRVVDVIVAIAERHPYVRGLRSWVGFRQVAFPYERDRRRTGAGKYTVWKLLDLAIAGIVAFSVVPLRLAALAGAGISILALGAGLVVLFGALPVLGGVLAAVTFLFGLQLLVIGMLGEYVGRVLEEVQNRPIFVVHDVVGLDPIQSPRDRERPGDVRVRSAHRRP